MDEKPILGYWKIRGLAQPIRLLLKYCGQEFEDKHYECGPAPNYNRDCWLNEKFKLGLDFPNLPYYIDGEVKVTQTCAIMRYIGKKYRLCGTTDIEQVRVDMWEGVIADFRSAFISMCYRPSDKDTFDLVKKEYLSGLDDKLTLFENFLKKFPSDEKWIAGSHISFVDFLFYEILDHHRILKSDCLEKFPHLTNFMNNIEAIPQIKQYMESKEFMKWPLNNKMAQFGGN